MGAVVNSAPHKKQDGQADQGFVLIQGRLSYTAPNSSGLNLLDGP
jgi:hypothetical protein